MSVSILLTSIAGCYIALALHDVVNHFTKK
jgi:hypothetical protein